MPDILTDTLEFGEGPAFHPDGDLWFVEIVGDCVTHVTNGDLERHTANGAPSAIIFDEAGRGLVCDGGQNSIRRFDPATEEWTTVVDSIDGEPLGAPNDLAFGPDGSLVFTCPIEVGVVPDGYVCCLEPDGTLKKIAEDMYFPNGLAFSEDGEELIVADSLPHQLLRGTWDSDTYEWTDVEVWADVGGPIGPDGMALGDDGRLYTAVFGSGQVRVVDQSGEVVEAVDVPGRDPTNIAFDPSGELGMVVTEAHDGVLVSYPEIDPRQSYFTGSGDWV